MPTTFHDREQAFEAKFAHDEEFRFLVLARRDKLFARWVAEALGLAAEEADILVKAVLAIPNGRGHDQAVLEHVAGLSPDLGSAKQLADRLDRFGQEALAQLNATPPGKTDLL
jgi:hypothetical protein